MFLDFFKKFITIIFPAEDLEFQKIIKMLINRIIYFPNKNMVIFLPYKNELVRKIIWSMKFKNSFKVCNFFGQMMYENIIDVLGELEMEKNFYNPIWINIPISFKRKLVRGYNQNDVITKSFFKNGGKNFVQWEKDVLKKRKNTKPQSRIKNRNERSENIKDSFVVKNFEKIKGRNILLFDDVMTTGATLNEAKKVLKKAGAKKVFFVVLAH